MINAERIKQDFIKLVTIDSLSCQEGRIADYVARRLAAMGAQVETDRAGEPISGQTGNIIARLPGNAEHRLPLMLNAHLDTVGPGQGIQPIFGQGKFFTNGQTILGADDKSGVAVILEALQVILENNIPHGEIGLVFTVAEEIGLLGAKHLDYSRINYPYCICYDHMNVNNIVHRAPTANSIKFKVYGCEAHAGVCPERGINAIQIAAQSIAAMPLGRIDYETTGNIGVIQGGRATNIVPNFVEIKGEARSHNPAKLARQTEAMRTAFREAVTAAKAAPDATLPRLEEEINSDYPLMNVNPDSPVISLVQQAADNLGRRMNLEVSGGGSDANIFNGHGIQAVILGTGIQNAHTTQEFILLQDMLDAAEMLVEIIKCNVKSFLE